jgi:hypothetical protein
VKYEKVVGFITLCKAAYLAVPSLHLQITLFTITTPFGQLPRRTKVAQPIHKQINERKDRPVAVNKSFLSSKPANDAVQDLNQHVPRYPSFLFAARTKFSTTLLRFGLEACSEIGSATCLRLFHTVSCKFFKGFSDIKLSSPIKSTGGRHDCRTTLPGGYSRQLQSPFPCLPHPPDFLPSSKCSLRLEGTSSLDPLKCRKLQSHFPFLFSLPDHQRDPNDDRLQFIYWFWGGRSHCDRRGDHQSLRRDHGCSRLVGATPKLSPPLPMSNSLLQHLRLSNLWKKRSRTSNANSG